MKATLDTCAVIEAFKRDSKHYDAMALLRRAWEEKKILLAISRRTLYQLSKKEDEAFVFARGLTVLPYYIIGTWNDCDDVTWSQVAGTWDDGKLLDYLQRSLRISKGADIKDRGIIVDSMQAEIAILVTTDKDLLRGAGKIEQFMKVRSVLPQQAVELLMGRRITEDL
jgi:hypothetical protein